MSTHEQITNNPTSAVRNTGGRNGPKGLEEPMSDEVLREMCDKNYHQLLPLITEKMQKEKEQKDKLNANPEEGAETGIPEAHRHTPLFSKDLRRTDPLLRGPGHGKEACLIGWEVLVQNWAENAIKLRHESKYTCLSENVRASLILGFPSISLVTAGGRSGSLVGQGPTYNCVCGRECSSTASVCPRMRTGAAEKILTCIFEISGAWPLLGLAVQLFVVLGLGPYMYIMN
ncbi:hypothetical protein Tco_1040240 [Tanacetum coccineum]